MNKMCKRRVMSVIRHIKKVISKQGLYSCEVAEIYDSSLKKITKTHRPAGMIPLGAMTESLLCDS